MNAPIRVGLSLMPSDDFRDAATPLIEAGKVEVVEWSVDFGFAPGSTPAWLEAWLDTFEARGALLAHGVELSPLSAILGDSHVMWLEALAAACRARTFRHLTEHYGFITAGDAVRGTPLPLPPSRRAIELGVERIESLRRTAGVPVGIENLAFAFGAADVFQQAAFVTELCERADAFVLLDVHNLFCQAENFDLSPLELAACYPLSRVRELHVAGGARSRSRRDPTRKPFVRDTHDADVPDAVFALVERLIPACPALSEVILERSDRSLFAEDERVRFRADFARLEAIVRAGEARPPERLVALAPDAAHAADTEADLDRYQRTLLETLRKHRPADEAHEALCEACAGTPYAAHVATFDPGAIEIAQELAQKWVVTEAPEGTMPAAVIAAPGAPLVLHHLPRVAPGPAQVLVRVTAAGLCGTDLHVAAGRLPVPMPIVPGHEYVGVIERVGEGVQGFAPGDRVGVGWMQRACGACASCTHGRAHQCEAPCTWVENGGGLSELAVAEASGCVRLPDGLADALAAPLFCAGYVAATALLRARLAPRERVCVLGLGGVGHLAVQIARAMGHEVVVVTSSEQKARDARALGASSTVVSRTPEEALAEQGVDVIVAATNDAATIGNAASALRQGGRMAIVGLADGALALDPVTLIARDLTVFGVGFGPRADLEMVLALAATGALVPRVETYPLFMAHRALDRLAEGRVRYRAVVDAF